MIEVDLFFIRLCQDQIVNHLLFLIFILIITIVAISTYFMFIIGYHLLRFQYGVAVDLKG